MKQPAYTRTIALGLACVAAGALAGIASTSASTSARKAQDPPGLAGGPAHFRLGGGPPIHGEQVVPNQAGNGFDTITEDRGAFKSLTGNALTITEGTKTLTYKDAALTIPANATVIRDGAAAKLSDITTGDEVHVAQTPRGTFVLAADAAHQRLGPPPRDFDRGHLRRGLPPLSPPPGPPPTGAPFSN